MRSASQLFLHLIDMILIDMHITECMDESSRLHSEEVSKNMDQERVGCDIEWNTEEEISCSLIELTIEFAILDRVLRESMTDREFRSIFRRRHRIEILRIPRRETAVACIWIFL